MIPIIARRRVPTIVIGRNRSTSHAPTPTICSRQKKDTFSFCMLNLVHFAVVSVEWQDLPLPRRIRGARRSARLYDIHTHGACNLDMSPRTRLSLSAVSILSNRVLVSDLSDSIYCVHPRTGPYVISRCYQHVGVATGGTLVGRKEKSALVDRCMKVGF